VSELSERPGTFELWLLLQSSTRGRSFSKCWRPSCGGELTGHGNVGWFSSVRIAISGSISAIGAPSWVGSHVTIEIEYRSFLVKKRCFLCEHIDIIDTLPPLGSEATWRRYLLDTTSIRAWKVWLSQAVFKV
jgi:hypothetical protein